MTDFLQQLLSNPDINEIMINGPGDVYVEENGTLIKTGHRFSGEDHVRSLVDHWVAGAGRRVDHLSPMVDFRLPDGSRVNVVLPPLSLQGPVITIRRFRPALLSFSDLMEMGSIQVHHPAIFMKLVQQRRNIVVAGNSASGKTTLLNILSGFIDEGERIITLEDAAELKLQKPHVIRLETRAPNAEGRGAVSMSDLVVNALRMRPDRILVGECRGAEIVPMLQALNTGHSGSMTTLHANSAADALQRMESMMFMEARDWPLEAIRRHIASAIQVIIYLSRDGAHRRLREVVSVGFDGREFVLSALDS